MVAEVNRAKRGLMPAFAEGEVVEIHRTLPNGQRIIVIAKARAASSLEPHRMHLQADISMVGASPHADGRVARQKASIERLLRHVQVHCNDPGNCQEFRDSENQREGNDNGSEDHPEDDASAAAPEQGRDDGDDRA